MSLVQSVVDGKITENTAIESTSKKTVGTSELGKDAFLQLLVTQMQHQDPLNPSTDTEFISQLATFSQLEEMQNLSQTTENAHLFTLIGKDVCVSYEDANGEVQYITDTVDYVTKSGGKAYLSINDSMYTLDQLVEVYEDGYLLKQKMPGIAEEQSFAFDGEVPKHFTFEINPGKEEALATDVAIVINDQVVNPEYITKSENYITLNSDIFQQLQKGTYAISVVFNNDPYYTTVSDKLSVSVTNTTPSENSDVFLEEKEAEGVEKAEGEESNEA